MPVKRDESFSSKERLRNSADFKRVFAEGNRIARRSFVLYCLRNRLGYSRLGIQVKARIGTAVERNYIKRIVREVFRKMKEDFQDPVDLIFIANADMKTIRYSQFENEFRKAMRKYFP